MRGGIRHARAEDLDEIAGFIATLNRLPEHRIGFADDDPESMRANLSAFGLPAEQAFVVAVDGGRLTGTFGADIDATLGQAWLYGPYLVDPGDDDLADDLWAGLSTRLPPSIKQLNMFFDLANGASDRFAERHGFSVYKDAVSIFDINRSVPIQGSTRGVHVARPEHRTSLAALHDDLFPTSSFSTGDTLLDAPDREVLVITETSSVIGFVTLSRDSGSRVVSLELLGVHPSAQRAGIGGRLVRAGLAWAFTQDGVDEVALTVDADNLGARALYKRLGFRHFADMRATRKRLDVED
jgi:ribosomal protein S18 acetylase RimI-like enzyme